MIQVTLQVDDEIKALGDAVVAEVADLKAKKGPQVMLADGMAALMSLMGNYSKLPADIKSPDDIGYLCDCAAKALLAPAPAAAPAAPAAPAQA